MTRFPDRLDRAPAPFPLRCLLAFVLCFVTLGATAPARADGSAATAPGRFFDAPYPQSGGTQRSLAAYRGKIVVANFWASWCGPCVREMPALSVLSRQYAARGVRFVGIGVDSETHIAAFLNKVPVDYPVHVAGVDGATLAREMGDTVGGLPYTVVIDDAGRIRWAKLGGIASTQLSAALDALVGPAPAPR